MSDKAVDYKKTEKALYLPGAEPVLVDVPAMNFIMVDGRGDPNGPGFEAAVAVLYGLSYTMKMSKMKGNQPPGYFDYVVLPLEGLWWINGNSFSFEQRDNWLWTVMIRQPEFVTAEVFAWAMSELSRRKPELNCTGLRFERFAEGLCVQALHRGPYATEPLTLQKMEDGTAPFGEGAIVAWGY